MLLRVAAAVVLSNLWLVTAGAQDLGPFLITSGHISDNGQVSGNGFTAGVEGGPEMLSAPIEDNFHGGIPPLNFCFGCGLPGPDAGVADMSVSGLSDPALAGLVQVFNFEGFVQSGELTVSPTIDVTGPGTYSSAFTMFARVAYGPPNATTPTLYVDFIGSGIVTITFGPKLDPEGPLIFEGLDYSFVPLPAALLVAVKGVGPGTSLADKVTLAQTYYSANDIPNTCSQLTAFVNEVNAQNGKSISQSTAKLLVLDAQTIQGAIGCQ
jgi:hypothetical protein